MPRIQVLAPHIANKIAAGEVVDRPASVVKELVENAIDADASEITVVIGQAGKELIQVIDNGIGMAPEDAELAFERHATSKISDVVDLDQILTLGFRGEALPSIASVSRMELKTCQQGESLGLRLALDGGVVEQRENLAMKHGTTISVKNLFFNTPARRNFLRTDTSEFGQILKWLKRFFLAYPHIHFTLIRDGEELYNMPASTQDERIVQVFGQKFYDGLVVTREELNDITLYGYVSRPDNSRGNSDNQFIYLNQRPITNRNLSHAVLQGYGNLIERGRFPQFVLFLDIPPHLVDINVHPTKMEVRFANQRVIYHLFLSAVRKAIQSGDIVPAFNFKGSHLPSRDMQPQLDDIKRFRPEEINPVRPVPEDSDSSQITISYDPLPPQPNNKKDPFFNQPTPPVEGQALEVDRQARLWQVHNRYIMSQIKSGLVVIDQHVAHERILYEQILDHLNAGRAVPSQQLLFPQTLELSLEDYLVYSDIREWLDKVGFQINELSGRTVVIEAIPADVKVGSEAKILIEMIDFYRAHEAGEYEPHEKIAAAFACKNAIKSGEKLNLEEMTSLVDQLFTTREPYFCPHGRPVIVTLGLEEFDRKFKRIK